MAVPGVNIRLLSLRPSLCLPSTLASTAGRTAGLRPFSVSARKQDVNNTKTDTFIELAKARRTIYQLGNKSPVPDSKIEELVNSAILNVPSSFNTQSTRLVVLLHDEHKRLWDIGISVFQDMVKAGTIPKEMWEKQTLPKLQGFQAGVGTVCCPESRAVRCGFVERFVLTIGGRFYSMKTQRTSSRSRRSLLSLRTNSNPGQTTLMLCTNTSVCLARPLLFFCFLFDVIAILMG
jgi:predicted oxidoreductase (fatty acid repression mutant protein)